MPVNVSSLPLCAQVNAAGLDPGVIGDFKAETHGKMDEAAAEEKSSCVKCHPPH